VSGREQKKQAGKKQREAGIAKIQSAVGNGIDLPGDGHRLRLCARMTAARAS